MRTRTRTTLAGLVLAAALVGGVAWATIPGTDATIQGCYTTGNGNLRVVENADDCRNSETAISWNEQGQAGVDGRDGQDGAPGAQGPKGEPGANGLDGAKGDKGDKGDTGDTGDTGATGATGVDGRDGAPGPVGAACLPTNPACVGPQGATGPQGPAGPKGDTGAPGLPGPGSATAWAQLATIGSTPAVIGGSGGLVSATRLRTGSYRLTFDRGVSACANIVTLASGGPFDAGAFEANQWSVMIGTSFVDGAVRANSVDVQVRNHANSMAGVLADGLKLHVVVFC